MNVRDWGAREPGIITASDLLAAGRRLWWWLPVLVGTSLIASILIVRAMTPAYEATVTMVENSDVGASSAGLLGSLGQGLLQSTDTSAELEEALTSRRLAEKMVKRADLRPLVESAFAPATAGGVRTFIRGTIYGLPTPGTISSVDQIQRSLNHGIEVDRSKQIVTVTFTHPDKMIARQMLASAIDEAQSIVAARKREQAESSTRYLSSLLQTRTDQTQAIVIANQLLPQAIARATLLSNPEAKIFSVIDEPYVSASPVKPRVGLIVAACIALAIAGWVLLIALWRPSRG